MRHNISYYDEDRKKIAFCVFCSCENIVELLEGNCPGKYINQANEFKKEKDIVDKLNKKD